MKKLSLILAGALLLGSISFAAPVLKKQAAPVAKQAAKPAAKGTKSTKASGKKAPVKKAAAAKPAAK
jgi:hypothetical protein